MRRRTILAFMAPAEFARRLRAAREREATILQLRGRDGVTYAVRRTRTEAGLALVLIAPKAGVRWRRALPLTDIHALGLKQNGAVFVSGTGSHGRHEILEFAESNR